jgi:uncharacterized protein YjbI with pentapeptide repeats
MKRTRFAKADLSHANFQPLIMGDGRHKQSDLTGANFRHCDLRHADFKQAILRGADFSFANVEGADFSQAEMQGIIQESVDFSYGISCKLYPRYGDSRFIQSSGQPDCRRRGYRAAGCRRARTGRKCVGCRRDAD